MNKGIGCESQTVTAAVNVEVPLVDESQSLEKSEKAERDRKSESSISVSQKTYKLVRTFAS